MNWLSTALPLIQAPMAGVQDSRLALAVCRAGALGSLPAAMLAPDALERELQALADCGLPYNANFFAHRRPPEDATREARWRDALAPYRGEFGVDPAASGPSRQPFDDAAASRVERFRPPVVSFHFGLPEARLLDRVKRSGARVLSSATTVAEALWLQDRGVDAVIAQGLQAGGHRGHFLDTDPARQQETLALVEALKAALRVPIVAAGGIVDAAGVASALAHGASAVQCGTAFLLCDEATTSPLHRARLRDAEAPTVLTNVFTGGLARGLVNRAVAELGPVAEQAPPFPAAAPAIAPLRAKAEAAGRDDFTPLWAGTRRDALVEAPAAEIVRRLAAGLVGG